ncbi:hypothetical protein [Burkholderia multivorans]|uniref:hypothetical protein n=1 Tax=Burkholderia multivorans TaxID=87883 RepID=UPI000D017ED7|nr:hypothetical protein [Burkholderia multivorans]PRH49756.1 hypothetical protein C6V05_03150 [Burkholderia multivorans]
MDQNELNELFHKFLQSTHDQFNLLIGQNAAHAAVIRALVQANADNPKFAAAAKQALETPFATSLDLDDSVRAKVTEAYSGTLRALIPASLQTGT